MLRLGNRDHENLQVSRCGDKNGPLECPLKRHENEKQLISFDPLIFLDNGKAHRVAPDFLKWFCFVAIPRSRCQENKSVAIGRLIF